MHGLSADQENASWSIATWASTWTCNGRIHPKSSYLEIQRPQTHRRLYLFHLRLMLDVQTDSQAFCASYGCSQSPLLFVYFSLSVFLLDDYLWWFLFVSLLSLPLLFFFFLIKANIHPSISGYMSLCSVFIVHLLFHHFVSNPMCSGSYWLLPGIGEVRVRNFPRNQLSRTNCFCFHGKHPKAAQQFTAPGKSERRGNRDAGEWEGELKRAAESLGIWNPRRLIT